VVAVLLVLVTVTPNPVATELATEAVYAKVLEAKEGDKVPLESVKADSVLRVLAAVLVMVTV